MVQAIVGQVAIINEAIVSAVVAQAWEQFSENEETESVQVDIVENGITLSVDVELTREITLLRSATYSSPSESQCREVAEVSDYFTIYDSEENYFDFVIAEGTQLKFTETDIIN